MTKSWFLSPMRALVKASQSPAGDHCGLPAALSPRVSCSERPVAVFASQICVTNASCFQSVSLTV